MLDDEARLSQVIDLYGALGRRDFVALQRLVAFDVVLDVGGSSWLAGRYDGMGAVIALGTKIGNRLVQGDSVLNHIEAREGTVEADVTVSISVRGHPEPFPVRLYEAFGFDEAGRIDRISLQADDQGAFDQLIGP